MAAIVFVFIAIVCDEQYVLRLVKPNDDIACSLTFVIFIIIAEYI